MSDFALPPGSERYAELVHRQQTESDEQRRRLRDAPTELVKRVLLDGAESLAARANALLVLLERRDPAMPDVLLGLFDDPDQDLWLAAIRSYCPPDPRIRERLRGVLDEPGGRAWSEAACALARLDDETILPRVLDWFRQGDEPHRNVAIECLLTLKDPEARRHLVEAYERGGRDEEDRAVLAVALLRSGDGRGVPFLESVARRADGAWSVMAATWLRGHDPALALGLMRAILDKGTLEARQAMVSQIGNLAPDGLPHAFTADGIHEARCWVEQQIREPSPEWRPSARGREARSIWEEA